MAGRSHPPAHCGAAPQADPRAGSVRLSLVVLALGLSYLLARHPAVAVEVEAQETTHALGMELFQRDRAVVVPVEAIEVPRAGGARASPAEWVDRKGAGQARPASSPGFSPGSAPVSFQGVMRGNQGGTLAL